MFASAAPKLPIHALWSAVAESLPETLPFTVWTMPDCDWFPIALALPVPIAAEPPPKSTAGSRPKSAAIRPSIIVRCASGRPFIALRAVLPPEFASARPKLMITARWVTVIEPSSAAVTVTICMISEPELSPTALVLPVPIVGRAVAGSAARGDLLLPAAGDRAGGEVQAGVADADADVHDGDALVVGAAADDGDALHDLGVAEQAGDVRVAGADAGLSGDTERVAARGAGGVGCRSSEMPTPMLMISATWRTST